MNISVSGTNNFNKILVLEIKLLYVFKKYFVKRKRKKHPLRKTYRKEKKKL